MNTAGFVLWPAKSSHPTGVRRRSLRLTIVDDGAGFDPIVDGNGRAGFGLVAMDARVEELGGCFRVESSPEGGTSVEVVLP